MKIMYWISLIVIAVFEIIWGYIIYMKLSYGLGATVLDWIVVAAGIIVMGIIIFKELLKK